jgi:hypothetical protein
LGPLPHLGRYLDGPFKSPPDRQCAKTSSVYASVGRPLRRPPRCIFEAVQLPMRRRRDTPPLPNFSVKNKNPEALRSEATPLKGFVPKEGHPFFHLIRTASLSDLLNPTS